MSASCPLLAFYKLLDIESKGVKLTVQLLRSILKKWMLFLVEAGWNFLMILPAGSVPQQDAHTQRF